MNRITKNRQKSNPKQMPLSLVLEEVVREELRSLVIREGMAALTRILEEERTALCGPAYGRENDGIRRAGTAPGELVIGGRKVRLKRPRVRDVNKEITLESYEYFSQTDPLTERALEQMLIGVSTRKYERSLEEVPVELRPRSTSKSAVSRRFVLATKKQLEACLSMPIAGSDIVTVMLDGIHFGNHLVVIAVGIDIDGNKQVLGFWEGSTENTEVCLSLLNNLVKRGLHADKTRLFVIDGGKALAKAIRMIYGKRAVIQRCQIHKMRNVVGHLPKELGMSTRLAMKEAYGSPSYESAKKRLKQLAGQLKEVHPGACESLMEGLDETIAIKRMGLPRTLEKCFASTNLIENLNGSIRRTTRRVKKWKSGLMVLRWVATSVVEAEKKFRRIHGYKGMPKLVDYLQTIDFKLDSELDEDRIAA